MINIPESIKKIAQKLHSSGFEVNFVGGCVRDSLLLRTPKDWDIATNAKPEEILAVFPDNSFYENNFGTVSVLSDSSEKNLKMVEITPYRIEAGYNDRRHPDEIGFSQKLEDDLSRRDFTVNAMALEFPSLKLTDLFGGQKDLERKIIRCVGNPEERFKEDALRLMRAPRFAAEINFALEKETGEAVLKMAEDLRFVSLERIRDELIKIIMCDQAAWGIVLLEKLGLLDFVLPELLDGLDVVGVTKSKKEHIKFEELSVFEHNVRTLDYAVKNNFNLETRLAALFHDIAKPATKKGEGLKASFKGHEIVGEKITKRALERLRFSKKTIDKVSVLVRCHFFFYDIDAVTEAGVRRLIKRVGPENIEDLLSLREADRSGSGLPKISSYRLKHLRYMLEKATKDPIHPKMMAIKGDDLMKILGIKPGPKIGWILNALLEEVLDDPAKNNFDNLKERAEVLGKMSDLELRKMSESADKTRENLEGEIDREMRNKYRV